MLGDKAPSCRSAAGTQYTQAQTKFVVSLHIREFCESDQKLNMVRLFSVEAGYLEPLIRLVSNLTEKLCLAVPRTCSVSSAISRGGRRMATTLSSRDRLGPAGSTAKLFGTVLMSLSEALPKGIASHGI